MERKITFTEGECYHVYTRGVDKREVFESERDYRRFMAGMLLCNGIKSVEFRNVFRIYGGEPSGALFEQEVGSETLADVLAYALMPNHAHMILREKQEGGISKFMLKLMTAYSMYFNTKHERSGPLFVRPFRAKHIDSDEYFRWVISYIHLNPLDLHESGWKERGFVNKEASGAFISSFKYSSYVDYFLGERSESSILNKEALPIEIRDLENIETMLREVRAWG